MYGDPGGWGAWLLIYPKLAGNIKNKYWSVLKQKRLKTGRRLNWNQMQSFGGALWKQYT